VYIIFRSDTDMIKMKSSPLRENKRQNSDDFIPLNVNNEDSNIKKSKYTHKNKKYVSFFHFNFIIKF